MYLETKGIVLNSVKYRETSVICKIYTEKLGLQTYIMKGVRKKRGGSGYFQTLSLLSLVVLYKKNKQINHIKEVKNTFVYKSIPFHVYKSSVAFFLAEIMTKCLKEEEGNRAMFNFISSSLIDFDNNDFDSQFHLRFLVSMSGYLGFFPNLEGHDLPYFDLLNGCFCEQIGEHKYYIKNSAGFVSALKLEKTHNKNEILDHILNYYQLHVDGFNFIKSKNILENVLSA